MVFTVLIFAYRKAGVSAAEFKAHFESSHVPLIKSIAGPLFPLSHTRRYIERSGDDAKVLIGTQADFEYDVIAELTFADEASFGAFYGTMQKEENAARLESDENAIADRSKTKVVVIGETITTSA